MQEILDHGFQADFKSNLKKVDRQNLITSHRNRGDLPGGVRMRASYKAVNIRQLTQKARSLSYLNPIKTTFTTRVDSESFPKFTIITRSSHHRTFTTTTTTTNPMSSTIVDSITQSLAKLSITPAGSIISHAETTSPATWREALDASPDAPKSFELIKVLVFKPKTAKTSTPIPVVVIARDETETNSGALGKKLNLKELRLASEDLLKEFFSLNKNSCMFYYFSFLSYSCIIDSS